MLLHAFSTLLAKLNLVFDVPCLSWRGLWRNYWRQGLVWLALVTVSLVAFAGVRQVLIVWFGVAEQSDLAALLWLMPCTALLEPAHHKIMLKWSHPQLFVRRTLSPLTPRRNVEMCGALLWIARIFWVAVLFTAIGISGFGLFALYKSSIVPYVGTPHLDLFQITLVEAAALAQVGLPIELFGLVLVGMRAIFIAALAAGGSIIFWQRNNHLIAFLVSLFLVTFAVTTGVPQNTLIATNPFWYDMAECLQAIASALIVLILFVFPNGKVTPAWAQRLVMPWLVTAMLWAFVPTAPFNFNYSETWERTLSLSLAHGMMWIGLGFASMIFRYHQFASQLERKHMQRVLKTWLWGFGIGNIRIVVPALFSVLGITLDGWPRMIWTFGLFAVFGITFAVCGLAFVISLFQQQLWETQKLRRTTIYSALLIVTTMAAALLVALLSWIAFNAINHNPTVTLIAALVLALIPAALMLRPIHRALNRRFNRQSIDANQALVAFDRAIRLEQDPKSVYEFLLDRCLALLQSSCGAIMSCEVLGQPRFVVERGLNSETRHQLQYEVTASLLNVERYAHEFSFKPLYLILALTTPSRHLLVLGPRLSEQNYRNSDLAVAQSLIERVNDWSIHREKVLLEQQISAHRQSSIGQAEAWAQARLATPETLLIQTDELASRAFTGSAEAIAVLEALPLVSARLSLPALRTLAEGYRLLCRGQESPEMIGSGLRTIIGALSQPQGTEWHRASATVAICRVLLRWLAPVNLAQIAETREEAQTLFSTLAEQNTNGIAIEAVLWTLKPVWQAILASEAPLDAHHHLHSLDKALAQSDLLQLATLPATAKLVAQQIILHWRTLITQMRHSLQVVASLHLRVTSHRVVSHDQIITLATEIQNTGLGQASCVQLEWIGEEGLVLIEQMYLPSELDTGAIATVLSRLALPNPILTQTQTLLLRARLRYQDGMAQPRYQDFDVTATVFHAPHYKHIINPYRIGTPLPAQSHLFMGREDDIAWLTETLASGHSHIVLVGQRRMGKTSLLKQLQARLSDQFVTVFLDVQRLGIDVGIDAGSGLSNFLLDIALEICACLNLAAPDAALFAHRPLEKFERVFLPDVQQALGHRKLLLLLDEFEELESRIVRGKLDDNIFAWLRHLMHHHSRLAFVFSGAHALGQMDPNRWLVPLNAAAQLRMGPISEHNAVQLITQPVEGQLVFDTLAIDHLLKLVSGHPYFVQVMCRVLVDSANSERRTYVLDKHIDLALPRALELSEGQLLDIWNDSTPAEQALLRALSQQTASISWVAFSRFSHLALPDENPNNSTQARAALQQLVQRHILKLRPHADSNEFDNADVGWELGLLWHWLRAF